MLCYSVPCCTMQCYAMLWYAMLYYAMLCYAMLYYAVLCYAMRRPITEGCARHEPRGRLVTGFRRAADFGRSPMARTHSSPHGFPPFTWSRHHCSAAPTPAVNWPTVGPNAASAREVTQGRERDTEAEGERLNNKPASGKSSQHA